MVENRSVPVKSLDQIVATHGLTTLDVLQIDAEGHDVRILESLTSLMPALVNFESMNLTGADWERFRDWAARHGYGFVRGFQDTLAIRGCHFEAE